MKYRFTSESVTEGHPDKMCDQISDAILDSMLACDPEARVACETAATTGTVFVMGEVSTHCYVDIPGIVRQTVADIGYTRAKYGFDAENCGVLVSIHEQSGDIAMGVDRALEDREDADSNCGLGAGDQGIMFGYACDETPSLMPMPIALAHALSRRLAAVRKSGELPWLRPDGKTQVTILYEDGRPVAVDTVVVSAQHHPDIDDREIREDIIGHVIRPVLPEGLDASRVRYLINPTGRFVVGGPVGDSGLTGRKIIVDTYGGYARHGGGAFSGKDPTKVDRSATYAARWVAKHVVAAGLASRCEIQLAYAIGVAWPVSVMVDTFGTGQVDSEKISRAIYEVFDLRPGAIIRDLDLRRPIYRQVAAYGHFGRTDLDLPWERLNRVEALRAAVCG
ncbi:MAG: methionine adenosyltransferase [Christensenellales bacterium]